jgi:hypothetical protein
VLDRARPVWGKVTSLIGYFDLDPNRALDIILDVLSIHLATHYSFFLALLSLSPWAGSYNPTESILPMAQDLPVGIYKGKTLDEILLLAETRGVGLTSRPATDTRVLAQVLGFKFRYYDVGAAVFSDIFATEILQASRSSRTCTKKHVFDCGAFDKRRVYYRGGPLFACKMIFGLLHLLPS